MKSSSINQEEQLLANNVELMNSIDPNLKPKQILAKVPILLKKSILTTIMHQSRIQNHIPHFGLHSSTSDFALLEVFYPAYCDNYGLSVLTPIVNNCIQHSFFNNPTNRFRSLVELTLYYPPKFVYLENLSSTNSDGDQYFHNSIHRLFNVERLSAVVEIPLTNFALNTILDSYHHIAPYQIAPINHSGSSFDIVYLNFIDRLAKSNLKFKHSGITRAVSKYTEVISALSLKLPDSFGDLKSFHLPATTFSSIIKTYFTSFQELISKKRIRGCLKDILKKMIAEKLAPNRVAYYKKMKETAILEKKENALDKLKQLEQGLSTRTLKEEKKLLSKLRKKKILMELRGKNVKMELERQIDHCIERIGRLRVMDSSTASNNLADYQSDTDSDSDEEEDNEMDTNGEPSRNSLRNIESLCFGWIESVMIPETGSLNRSIVHQALPNVEEDVIKFIIKLVNSFRLYYPRYETLKVNKELNKTQCIPFLSLTNWIFSKLDYTHQIKKFIPEISVGKLWALNLNKDTIYEMFLHKKAGLFSIEGITTSKQATPLQMFHMLFRSSIISKAIHQLNMLNNGQKENAIFADRYFVST